MGALARDVIKMDFKVLTERIAVLRGNKRDPYFSFSDIEAMHKETQKPIFFWLLGDYGKFDKNTDYENDELKKLIKDFGSKYKIGIHPSYASNEKENGFVKEKNRLESISVQDITKSRQHFLKLKFPDTYLKLLEIDLDFVWECAPADVFSFEFLAQEFFGAGASLIEKGAMWQALQSAPIYFAKKGKGQYVKQPQEQIQIALAAVAKKEERLKLQAQWMQELLDGNCPAEILQARDAILRRQNPNDRNDH
jgi:hypothetical protein